MGAPKMALDFPASPSPGQLYVGASNNVTYIWNATYQSWLPLSMAANQAVDFYAQYFGAGISTQATIVFPTIVSGNSGGWYNSSNGRFTPPAGRYHIFASVNTGSNSAASVVTCYLRKNGTVILSSSQVPGSAGWYGDPQIITNQDANGTDWFDIQGFSSAGASGNNLYSFFGAFSLTAGGTPPVLPTSGGRVTISDTPPASPVPGNLWWNSTTGTLLIYYFDGNSYAWVQASVTPTPSLNAPPALMVYSSAANIAVPTSATTLNWDTVDLNTTGGTYSAGTFTVPSGKGGLWNCQLHGYFVNGGNGNWGYVYLYLLVNGTNTRISLSTIPPNSVPPYVTMELNSLIRLNAGDAVTSAFGGSQTGMTLNLFSAPNRSSFW